MPRKIFLRQGYWRYSKLGLRRKKKLVYRKAKGRDNKVRLQEKGRLIKVKIGFKKSKKIQGLIKGLRPVYVRCIEDIKELKKDEIAVIGKIGNKKRLFIAKYISGKNIPVYNLNVKKFIDKMEELKKNNIVRKVEEEKKVKEKEIIEKKVIENREISASERDDLNINQNKLESRIENEIKEVKK